MVKRVDICQVAFHIAGILISTTSPRRGTLLREQTWFRPITAAISPNDMCLYFSSQATSSLSKTVFFVMTFITVCWRGLGYLGYQRLGKDK